MATFFAGNVLPATASQTSIDDQDPTYRFTREEAESLDLVGKPIRCEHSKTLECGVITKSMIDKTGKVYIIGKLHDTVDQSGKKNAINIFADKALGNTKKGNKAYYPSLSLQHVHEENADGSVTRKRGLEVSLVHEPRRANCNIIGVSRLPQLFGSKKHAASVKSRAAQQRVSENQDYIGDASTSNAEQSCAYSDMSSTESAKPAEPSDPTPPETTPTPVVTTKPVAREEIPATTTQATKEADGDFKMGDVVNVVLQQETELDRLKAQLAVVSKERDEHKTVNDARKKAEEEKIAAQKQSDLEKSQALLSTLTSLWDEQVPDAVWTENKEDNIKKMQEFAEREPALAKQLFSVVHSASSRYASVLNSDSERERMLSSKLGHVMKKRKIHAASARSAETPAAPPKAAAPAAQSDPKDLMTIMKQYGNNVSGTAHSLMNKLYKQQMERRRTPF